MDKVDFFLGIGSQRCGTTLMYHLLKKYSNVFMHPVKEIQYFSKLYRSTSQNIPRLRKKCSLLKKAIEESISTDEITTKHKEIFKNLSIGDFTKIEYLDLFADIIKKNSNYNIFGEISPEYMLLDNNRIDIIKNTLGENTRILLICRHPIERTLSSLSLRNFINANSSDNHANLHLNMTNQEANLFLKEQIETDGFFIRQQIKLSSYEKSIKQFESKFSKFLVIRYEDLINDKFNVLENVNNKLDIKININEAANEISTVRYNSFSKFNITQQNLELLKKRYKNEIDFYDRYFIEK